MYDMPYRERSKIAVKRFSVSTGSLHALLRLHFRPIDLVVFQGSFGHCPYET